MNVFVKKTQEFMGNYVSLVLIELYEIYILFNIECVLVLISCKQTGLKFENLLRIIYIVQQYCYKPISILQLNYLMSDPHVHYRFYKKLSC